MKNLKIKIIKALTFLGLSTEKKKDFSNFDNTDVRATSFKNENKKFEKKLIL